MAMLKVFSRFLWGVKEQMHFMFISICNAASASYMLALVITSAFPATISTWEVFNKYVYTESSIISHPMSLLTEDIWGVTGQEMGVTGLQGWEFFLFPKLTCFQRDGKRGLDFLHIRPKHTGIISLQILPIHVQKFPPSPICSGILAVFSKPHGENTRLEGMRYLLLFSLFVAETKFLL